MRPIRLAESALDDIDRQLEPRRADLFRRVDLRSALEHLSRDVSSWDDLALAHGPAWRVTVTGSTVAGFHLFGVEDTDDPREGAIVIYFIDIWRDEFPE